jgi:hypothetical protein
LAKWIEVTDDGGELTHSNDSPPSVLRINSLQIPVVHECVPRSQRSFDAPAMTTGVTGERFRICIDKFVRAVTTD